MLILNSMTKRVSAGSASVAVAYIRVSTDKQELGPEAQRSAIDAWAAREGVQVAAYCVDEDVCSVTPTEERKGLSEAIRAIADCRAGYMVVAKRDRIARDVVLTSLVERAVEAAGARVVSAAGEGNGDTPADQFMRTVIDGAAQYERALIRGRTRAALAVKKARGERTGAIPYGYRLGEDGARLEADEGEQTVISLVVGLSAQGLAQRKIAAELTARGLLSRVGRPFALAQVQRMLHKRA